MARTKQTARKITGGKAPRNNVSRANRKLQADTANSYVPLPQLDPTNTNTTNSIVQNCFLLEEAEEDGMEEEDIEKIDYDVSYESSFYAHYFKLSSFGDNTTTGDIFVPKFSLYKTLENNENTETSTQDQKKGTFWFCLNFSSSYDGPGLSIKNRPPLNIVIALDLSGSMTVPFNGENKSKITVAKECILSVTKQLRDDDYFGFIVFTTTASVIQPLKKWSEINEIQFAKTILKLKPGGGTSLQTGLDLASSLLKGAPEGENRYSRICFLTDMEANENSDETSFILNVQRYSRDAIYTSIIGIGVNLSRKSVVDTSNTPGCNYCNVISDENFRELMNSEFPFLVTPIAFNVVAKITNQNAWSFYSGYGSPEISEFPLIDAKFSSVFPTSMDADLNARSGCFLFKLAKADETEELPPLEVTIDWEDVQGILRSHSQIIPFDETTFAIQSVPPVPPTPNSMGIRKAILLVNFTDFAKEQVSKYNTFVNYLNERSEPPAKKQKVSDQPTIIPLPPVIGDIQKFKEYFSAEKTCLEDPTLQGELDILTQLENYI